MNSWKRWIGFARVFYGFSMFFSKVFYGFLRFLGFSMVFRGVS